MRMDSLEMKIDENMFHLRIAKVKKFRILEMKRIYSITQTDINIFF